MDPKEFFERVEKSLKETRGDDPIGVDYFLTDIGELAEQWQDEDDHERKF